MGIKRTCVAIVGVVTLLAVGSGAGEKRAFTIADHYRVVGVADPQPSPDGSRIAYVTSHTDLEKAKRWSTIRLLDADGSGGRALTEGTDANSSPRWSPDGRTLAFLSSRDGGTSQLFLLPLAGGEARQLTTFATGVADPVWSPDGRFVAVTSEVYPECGADAACTAKTAKAWADGPLHAHMADELLYRHWTSWRDGRFAHILLVEVATGSLTDLTPGRFDAPTFSVGGGGGYAFAPDGREMAFVSNHDAEGAASTNADIWLLPLGEDGTPGTPVNATAANRAWDGTPVYSPDGRTIAYRCQKVPGYEADLFRVALLDRSTGRSRVVTEAFRDWIDAVAWAPDGTRLAVRAQIRGRTPLLWLDPGSGATTPLLEDGTIDAFALDARGGVVVARRHVDTPAELLHCAPGKDPVRLTAHNDALLAEVDFRPAEELWLPGDGGSRIHVFLVKPHGFDPTKRYPLIVNVHGGPQMQWADAYRGDWQVYPGAGYVVAFLNPAGSTGYGQELTDAISRDWGGRVARDVVKVTDALAQLPFVDPDRMGAMGWSYGGYMMMWLEGQATRFKALAAMMGLYDLRSFHGATEELWFPRHDLGGVPWLSDDYRTFSPSERVARFATPCLVITGEKDFRVPYTQSLHFFTDLQAMKVPSRLVVLPEAGHWPSWYEMAFYYDLHLDWFHRYLGGGAAPWDPEKFLRNQALGQ